MKADVPGQLGRPQTFRSKVMKKVTILIEDSKFSMLNLGELVSSATNFTVETIDEKPIAKRKKHRDAGMTIEECLMSHFTMHGEFIITTARKWLEEKGFAGTSASPALSSLVKDGNLEIIKKGRYRFVAPLEHGAIQS